MEKENIVEIVIGKNYTKTVEIFLKYFMNIVKNLDIRRKSKPKMDNDPIINAIKTFEKHLSIRKKVICILTPFLVLIAIKGEVEKEKSLPNESTVSQEKDLPVKTIKGIINKNFNHEIDIFRFMKKGDGKPIFKKNLERRQRKLSVCKHLSYLI